MLVILCMGLPIITTIADEWLNSTTIADKWLNSLIFYDNVKCITTVG